MMHAQAYMPIIAAAAAELVVGMVWYSDQLFGPMFRKMSGKKAPKDIVNRLAMHAVVALLRATALFIAISIFQKTQTAVYAQDGFGKVFSVFLNTSAPNNSLISSVKTAGFMWLGFYVPSKASCTIWGDQNWQLFAMKAAYQFTLLATMAAVIASLS